MFPEMRYDLKALSQCVGTIVARFPSGVEGLGLGELVLLFLKAGDPSAERGEDEEIQRGAAG